MSVVPIAPVQPDAAEVKAAVEALPRVTSYLATHPESMLRLAVVDDAAEQLVVPRGAVELLGRILAHMAAGQGVSVVSAHAELTTQQAADLLNVSRPFLIGLLDSGAIKYRKVGKHRRVNVGSLLAYMARDEQERRDAADELTRLSQDADLL